MNDIDGAQVKIFVIVHQILQQWVENKGWLNVPVTHKHCAPLCTAHIHNHKTQLCKLLFAHLFIIMEFIADKINKLCFSLKFQFGFSAWLWCMMYIQKIWLLLHALIHRSIFSKKKKIQIVFVILKKLIFYFYFFLLSFLSFYANHFTCLLSYLNDFIIKLC